jgi:GTPase SAR1 family protein
VGSLTEDVHLVYDVSNKESFDALPRWYSELETYVSESVVKIVVGNKVDKVESLLPLPVFQKTEAPGRNSRGRFPPPRAKLSPVE